MKSDDNLIRDLLDAALSIGNVLQDRPAPLAFHRADQPNKANRPLAMDEFKDALDAVKSRIGLQGDTQEDLAKSIHRSGGSPH